MIPGYIWLQYFEFLTKNHSFKYLRICEKNQNKPDSKTQNRTDDHCRSSNQHERWHAPLPERAARQVFPLFGLARWWVVTGEAWAGYSASSCPRGLRTSLQHPHIHTFLPHAPVGGAQREPSSRGLVSFTFQCSGDLDSQYSYFSPPASPQGKLVLLSRLCIFPHG
jgi:hypothetical protein